MMRPEWVLVTLMLLVPGALAGGTWDGGTWDGGTWDGGTWDGGTWDGGTWDGGVWPAAFLGAPLGWHPAFGPSRSLACVIDTGIDMEHPALARFVRHARSFVDTPMGDSIGHGTHLAGLVVAVGAPGLAIAKVDGADGLADTAAVTAALEWCVSLRADVILLAITEHEPPKAFEKAVKRAAKESVLVVSGGNAGPCERCLASPAELASVLAVGAVGADLRPAAFSSSGAKIDLYAPGVGIVSTLPGGGFGVASGTSQAAAIAAGAAARVDALNPAFSPKEVTKALVRAATPIEGERAPLLSLSAP